MKGYKRKSEKKHAVNREKKTEDSSKKRKKSQYRPRYRTRNKNSLELTFVPTSGIEVQRGSKIVALTLSDYYHLQVERKRKILHFNLLSQLGVSRQNRQHREDARGEGRAGKGRHEQGFENKKR